MRLHVVGLPHTETTVAYSWCAYTQKVRRFCDMMSARGHQVFLYAGPRNEASCSEHVVCVDELPPAGTIPEFYADAPPFAQFNQRAIAAIGERLEARDFVCLIGGTAQQPIADAFPAHQVVEFGIGYGGVIASTHHVFESYAWMHTVLGALTGGDSHRADGRFFDAVIPNYYDPAEFPAGDADGDYLLFIGRLIERKGIQIALDAAAVSGLELIVAGAGDYPLPDWVDHRGVVGPVERAELMGGARALLSPTLYVEPFGGVAVEAQLCGTPVVTTDWGAFTETVEHGVTGFRCRTLAEFTNAIERAGSLDRDRIREHAIATWSLDAIGPRYESYFERLQTLWGDGFYADALTTIGA
jgi:glycosyltransferase involved in cell wall biosynthesis